MPRYLTPEWFDAARAALAASPTSPPNDDAGTELVVQHVVTGGPDGDVPFHVDVVRGAARIEPGTADDPTVTFTESWATAVAIARGELAAQEAFRLGHVQVRGDLMALVERASVVNGLDAALADLRSRTEYEVVDRLE